MPDLRPPAILDRLWDEVPVTPPPTNLAKLARARAVRRRRVTSGALSLAVVAMIACITVLGHPGLPDHATPASHQTPHPMPPPVHGMVVLDAEAEMTFTPAPSSVHARLTSDQAFRIFAEQIGSKATHPLVPTRITLGYLNEPRPANAPKGERYLTYRHELVWAYTFWDCMSPNPPVLKNGRPNMKVLPPPACNEWMFLNANHGYHVLDTWLRYPNGSNR